MDLDSLHHKRLKLFDPRSPYDDNEPTTSRNMIVQKNVHDKDKQAPESHGGSQHQAGPANKQNFVSWTDFSAYNMMPGNQFAFHEMHTSVPVAKPGPPSFPPPQYPFPSNIPHWQPPSGIPASYPGAMLGTHHSVDAHPFKNAQPQVGGHPLPDGPLPPASPPSLPDPIHAQIASRKRAPRPKDPPLKYLVAESIDHSDEALAVRSFARATIQIDCRQCYRTQTLSYEELNPHFDAIFDKTKDSPASFLLACESCGSEICVGCGATVTTEHLEYGATTVSGLHLTWHCDRGRLALLWLLLCGYDRQAKHNKPFETITHRAPESDQPQTTKHAHHPAHSQAKQGAAPARGVGYASDRTYDFLDDYLDSEPSSAFVGPGISVDGKVVVPSTTPVETSNSIGGDVAKPSPNYSMAELMAIHQLPAPSPPSAATSKEVVSNYAGPSPTAEEPVTSTKGSIADLSSIIGGTGELLQIAHPSMPFTKPSAGENANKLPPTAVGNQALIKKKKKKKTLPIDLPPDILGDIIGLPLVRGRKCTTTRKVDPDDALTAQVSPAIAAIMPSYTALVPTAFDHEPPLIIASMLSRSSMLDKAAELLRNDSLEDAGTRLDLYERLLDLVRVLASGSGLTAGILHAERTINKAGHDLSKVSYGLPTRMQNEELDTATSVMQSITNLACQSGMMLRSAQANTEIFDSEEGQRFIRLCTNIIDCKEMLEACTPRRTGKGKAKQAVCEDKNAWQKELAVLEVPDEDILAVHYSAKAAKECKNPTPGRMRHVIQEVTNLQTSLPSGIFIRYGESRLDVMKVLIVGPKDTPYENGLFEFDLWCPPDYPNEPPQMHIKTTGGGKHRFNPNLYADGKVCLSLLNTWQGARWTPGQSTILQVLVSIQAMIFCDEPHCNEPGYEQELGSEQSKEYNRHQYPAVIKYAMLEWLEGARTVTPTFDMTRFDLTTESDVIAQMEKAHKAYKQTPPPVDKSDMWAPVVRKHFEAKQDEILQTVCRWINDKSPHGRGKGRRLGTASTASEAPAEVREVEELMARGKDLPEQLKAALEEFPRMGKYGLAFYGHE